MLNTSRWSLAHPSHLQLGGSSQLSRKLTAIISSVPQAVKRPRCEWTGAFHDLMQRAYHIVPERRHPCSEVSPSIQSGFSLNAATRMPQGGEHTFLEFFFNGSFPTGMRPTLGNVNTRTTKSVLTRCGFILLCALLITCHDARKKHNE